MANVLYDINTGTRITPYIGAGVGGTMAWMKRLTQLNFAVTGFLNDDSMKVAYQGIVGVAIAIAPQWESVIDFRYRVSDGHDFESSPNRLSKFNIRETTVMAGLRYAF